MSGGRLYLLFSLAASLLFLRAVEAIGGDDEEFSKQVAVVDQRPFFLDQEGRYLNTRDVWMYVVFFSVFLAFCCLGGCVNLYWIRWHYRRKCAIILEQMETQHKRRLETSSGPTPFGVPIRAYDSLQQQQQQQQQQQPLKSAEIPGRCVWDPLTLAQLTEVIDIEKSMADELMQFPYRAVVIDNREAHVSYEDEMDANQWPTSTDDFPSALLAGSNA